MPAIDETLLTSFMEAPEGDFNAQLSAIVSDVQLNKINGEESLEILNCLRGFKTNKPSGDLCDEQKKRYVTLFLLCTYSQNLSLRPTQPTLDELYHYIALLIFKKQKEGLIKEIFAAISSIQEMMKEPMSSPFQAEAVASETTGMTEFLSDLSGLAKKLPSFSSLSPFSASKKPEALLDIREPEVSPLKSTALFPKSLTFAFTNGLALQHALNQESQNKQLIFSKIQACLLDVNFKEQQSAYEDFVETLPDVVKKFGNNIPLFLALSNNDGIVEFKEKLIGYKSLLDEVAENVSVQEKLLELNQKVSSISYIERVARERVDSDRSKLGEIQTLFKLFNEFFTVVDEQVREKADRVALVGEIQKRLSALLKITAEISGESITFFVNLFSVDNEKYKQYVHQLFPVVAGSTLEKQDALDRSLIIAKIADDENLKSILYAFAKDAVIGEIPELQAIQLELQKKLCEPVSGLIQARNDFENSKRQREQEKVNSDLEKLALERKRLERLEEKKCLVKAELPDYIKNATGIADSITAILATRDEEEKKIFIEFFNEYFLYKTTEDASDLLVLPEWQNFYSNTQNFTLENLKVCVSAARKNWFEKTVYKPAAERWKSFLNKNEAVPKEIFGILKAVIKDENLENTFAVLYQKILALLTDSTIEFRTPKILQSIKQKVEGLINVQRWNAYKSNINEAVILDLANVIEAVVKECEKRPIAEEEVTQAGEIQTSEAAENNSNISKQITEHCFPLLCVLEKEEDKLSNPKLFDVELFDSSKELREQKKKDISALKKNCLCITALKITKDLSDTASVDDTSNSNELLSRLVTESKSKIESGSLSEHRNYFRRFLDWAISKIYSKSAIETPSTEGTADQKTLPQCSYFSPKSLKRVTNSFPNYQEIHLNPTPSRGA